MGKAVLGQMTLFNQLYVFQTAESSSSHTSSSSSSAVDPQLLSTTPHATEETARTFSSSVSSVDCREGRETKSRACGLVVITWKHYGDVTGESQEALRSPHVRFCHFI